MTTACISAPVESNVDSLLLQQAFQQQQKEFQLSLSNERKQCFQLSSGELQTKYEQRRECAKQIHALCQYFDSMSHAVFAFSVGIMDSALMKANIPWKYLSCFSSACFMIASKWTEDEYHPTLSVLADLHYKQWKEVDLRRMEEKVLQMLNWQMPRCTYLSFLPHLTHLLSAQFQHLAPMPPVGQVIRNAELLLLQEFSFLLKPAAVALGALEHTLRQCGTLTRNMSCAVVALQDMFKVLDSELHEVDEVLNSHDKLEKAIHKSNKAYFPKKFETPYDSFYPDYRLYNIPEESSNSESELSLAQKPLCHQPSLDASVSSYDYSDEEKDDSVSNGVDKSESSRSFPGIRDSEDEQYICLDSDAGPSLHDVCGQGKVCETEQDPNSTILLGSMPPESTEQSSSTKHCPSIPSVAVPTTDSDGYFSTKDNDSDSGCEQDSDEDSCSERDCSERDSSEQDSVGDQDSDFHDASPCRICLVKSCVDEAHGQALTFD